MSPLHCSTVREALWERSAGSGPAALSPTLADHLSACTACQAEGRAVRQLIESGRAMLDPAPPPDIWDGFENDLAKRLDGLQGNGATWRRWGRRSMGMAAVLAVGFALGVLAMRAGGDRSRADLSGETIRPVEEIPAELANDARLEFYLDEIEDLLVTYRAADRGEALDVFRRSLPATMMAGPALPSESDRQRLEQQRATREQLRSVVLGMLASEIEAERQGFAYLDRRIAEVAGQQLLYFVH